MLEIEHLNAERELMSVLEGRYKLAFIFNKSNSKYPVVTYICT